MTGKRMCFSENELIKLRDEYYWPLANSEGSRLRLYGIDTASRERNEFQRDYTRIIYSSYFRRLQGKMQLIGTENDRFFRNRLTHSVEVAQIARSIAEDIGHDIRLLDANQSKNQNIYFDDLYVVESCALAQDIGNPPFGHKGESVLNTICANDITFEGNAQSLRVLMELEKELPNIGGLNLTLRTLLGITKYYNKYLNITDGGKISRNKKFIYNDTYSLLKEKISQYDIKVRTLDVQIVDLSDEIAYAAHDLEDALSLNLFTVDDLLYEFTLLSKKEGYENSHKQLDEIINESRNEAMKARSFASSGEYSYVFRKQLTSTIVNRLIKDIGLVPVKPEHIERTGTKYEMELGFRELGGLARGLKDKVFDCINRRDHIQLYEEQGEKIIRGLYSVFIENEKYLPEEFRFNGCEENERKRKVVDYIAGMMDSYAISTYLKFYGSGSLDRMFVDSFSTEAKL